MCSRRLSVDKKVELTSYFSGVDPPQSTEVRQRWDQSWSQIGPPPPPQGVQVRQMGTEWELTLNSGQKVQPKYGSAARYESEVDHPHHELR